LKEELEKHDFKVGRTRNDKNKDLGLVARGQKAKGCDLFMSLHSDAIDGKENEGLNHISVFAPFDKSNNSFELAHKLASAISECMGVPAYAKTQESTNGGDEYYSVLYGARSVGCPLYYIIEHSFHTNKRSAEWLLDEDNLRKLAKVEAEVIKEWVDEAEQEEKPQEKPSSNITVILPMLSKGSKGQQAKNLQILLKGKGYDIGVYGADGDFGDKTKEAVMKFQKDNGLADDGVVGQDTWNALLGGIK
jgi:hypothetical protein